MKVTAEQLKQLVPNASLDRLKEVEAALNFSAVEFPGLYKVEVLEEFVPQVVHETGGFRVMAENGNYKAERILAVFPKYFKTLAEAQPFANNPQKLFNKVYANRMGNGSEASGDGYRFRGGGGLQITGRDMYTKYAKYIGEDVELTADLVRDNLFYSMHSACWVFAVEKKLIDEALANDYKRITYLINGGYNGEADRNALYQKWKKIIGRA